MNDHDPLPASEAPSLDLLRKARAGDRSALNALIGASRERLARIVHARLGPELRKTQESSDLLQSALGDALRDLPRFEYRGKGSFVRWLAEIVNHKILHHARDRRRQKRNAARVVSLDAPASGTSPLAPAAPDPSPSQVAAASESESRLRAALLRLEADERDLIVWRHFEELSCKETAELLEVTEACASKRYLRALERLHGILIAGGMTGAPTRRA